ncbi:hypothetical protein J7E70_02095 [Variovorax paradoxus]|nr:hypothetical protein [Variovorax paradoxus]MBT2299245.1 hypothetical protein [Variovorax paradoxus]
MNCRPKDVAVVARPHPAFANLQDRFVRVTRLLSLNGGGEWELEDRVVLKLTRPIRVNGKICFAGQSVWLGSVFDSWLRPIRDPGDDAIDWVSLRTQRSADLREDALTRARKLLAEATS